MKFSDLPIRLHEVTRTTTIEGAGAHLLPYIFLPGGIRVWIQPVDRMVLIGTFSINQRAQVEDENQFRMLRSFIWGKPISKDQTPETTTSLPLVAVGQHHIRRANMVGLFEIANNLPEGDGGEVFLVQGTYLGEPLDLYGAWADSQGAAKRFVNRAYAEMGTQFLHILVGLPSEIPFPEAA